MRINSALIVCTHLWVAPLLAGEAEIHKSTADCDFAAENANTDELDSKGSDLEPPKQGVYESVPYSAIVLVPSIKTGKDMLRQPSEGVEFTMPVVKPTLELIPFENPQQKDTESSSASDTRKGK